MSSKVCLVTTLRDAENVLGFFINYHLNIGFDHLFLFIDDIRDLSFLPYLHNENITILRTGYSLQHLWEQTESYSSKKDYINKEVMARQILNAEVAIQLALQKGFDWILHIDIDELFYSQYPNIHDHFDEMDEKNIGCVTYLNHEAIPESPHVNNYFSEVNLFKKNILCLSQAQKEIVQENFGSLSRYFNYYKIGKSAARLHERLFPFDVHTFQSFSGEMIRTSKPCILHYPCCGFYNFYVKYKTLSNFSDKWFDQIEIVKRLPVHVVSRDVVGMGDIELAKEYYEEIFLGKEEYKINLLISEGICFRAFPD